MAKNFKSASAKKNRKYKVVYTINHYKDGKDVEWVKQNGLGACDAALLGSVVRTEDGGVSVLFVSLDGKTGEDLTDQELFKLWGMLGEKLSKSTMLGDGSRKLCAAAWGAIKDAMSKVSGKGYLS